MKKIISILVAVCMLVSVFAVSAFAAAVEGNIEAANGGVFQNDDTRTGIAPSDYTGGSNSADVQIQINGAVNHRYAVDITFDAQVFTLSTGATWNPETHTYEYDTPLTWNGTGYVTVTNHSDLAITYEAEATVTNTNVGDAVAIVFNGATTYAPIAATEVAACTVNGTAPYEKFSYGVVGEPIVAELDITTLGTIKVTVKPATTDGE